MAKAGNVVMSRHNYKIVATKPQGNMQKFVATKRKQKYSKAQLKECRYISKLFREIMKV